MLLYCPFYQNARNFVYKDKNCLLVDKMGKYRRMVNFCRLLLQLDFFCDMINIMR